MSRIEIRACTVPACVYEISLSVVSLHLLNELLSILSRVEFEERLTEASRESRSGLSDATLCAGELGSKAGEEVVLSLLRSQDRHGRQYAECVSRKEDHVLSGRTCRDRFNDALDVVDRIRYASVLSHALVSEINLAILVNSDVLEKSVTTDSFVDIGLALLVKVDNLSVAATLEVEDAVIVPAVLVVTDEKTFRVSREGSLACAGETEEDSSVLALFVSVGRAVHRSDALLGKIVVHHGEHTLLHLTAIPLSLIHI